MKNIKKMMTAATLMMVLMVGTSFGGVILANSNEQQPCTERTPTIKTGVILADLTGVILADFTGVILAAIAKSQTMDCGVILADQLKIQILFTAKQTIPKLVN